LLRVAERAGAGEVQFILLPYPTPTGYLKDGEAATYTSAEEKNRQMQVRFTATLQAIQNDVRFNTQMPTVLAAHVHVQGGQLHSLYRMALEQDVILPAAALPTHFAYIALGHIHKPQALLGAPHIRYSGSIERLDLGERDDAKSVVVFEVGPQGLQGEPRLLPLEATPIYALEIHNPREELPRLRERYPDARRDLVQIQFTYRAGVDSLEDILRELDAIFPRWYHRHWTDAAALGPALSLGEAAPIKSFEDTVRDYLKQELLTCSEDERDAVLALAEKLMAEME
jgi:DNA repair exonuclease SbcCD nuclease subunit